MFSTKLNGKDITSCFDATQMLRAKIKQGGEVTEHDLLDFLELHISIVKQEHARFLALLENQIPLNQSESLLLQALIVQAKAL